MVNELSEQLQHIIDALAADLYHPLGDIFLEGFLAPGDLSLREAQAHAREPWPAGTVWGGPWDYAWMFADFTLPPQARGERIVMELNPGGEATLFVNSKAFGARRADRLDHPHQYAEDLTIAQKAEGGESVSIAMEVYGGTPLPDHPSRPVFPEEGVAFTRSGPAVVGKSTFGWWNEEAYQLWLDLTVLRDVHAYLDPNDGFREALEDGFARLLDFLDLELPLPARRQACVQARALIAPLVNAHNGTFAASMGVVANSHLDLAWLWPMDETRRKTARTFAAQLRLLKEYPEAIFLQSQCAEYELCRRHYPELFEEVKAAIREGRWIADGGMWVEPDTNMAGGEALVRQFLYGQRYFREVLGVESRVAWLPDTFGYSAALPQIIKGFGMTGLTTQKIFWSYNDAEPFPHHAFLWRGLDGTAIPSFLHMFYETQVDAKTVHTRWVNRLERDGSCDFYLPFGYGDGGGGPTRDDMEQVRRQRDLQGAPKLYWISPGDYLKKRDNGKLPVYRGELYVPCHRGTYTTQAAIKKGNRRAEHALRAWEMLAAIAAFSGRAAYPGPALEKNWKQLLINQFHDILPGSSIARVYERARAELNGIRDEAMRGAKEALGAFLENGGGLTVFNPSSHRTTRLIRADSRFVDGAVSESGERFPAEADGDGALILASLEPMAAVTLYPAQTPALSSASVRRDGDRFILQNTRLRAVVTEKGALVSLVTLSDGKERVRSASNVFHLYRDLPRRFDAWDLDSQTERREVPLEAACEAEIVCARGLTAKLKIVSRFSASVLTQHILLTADAEQLVFETEADWQERHRLLKVSFDTGIDADQADHQIQFGFISRPAHRSRRFDTDRFEVSAHAWTALRDATHGAAVLNDCKYGVSVNDGVIGLSLLRAPTFPDAEADRGYHRFVYAFRPWSGTLEESGVAEAAEALNDPLIVLPGRCAPLRLLACSDPAVAVESVKLADDGSGEMLIRLFESMGGARTAAVRPCLPYGEARLCTLAEEPGEALKKTDGAFELTFRPFEIITVRLSRPDGLSAAKG
ncbi:MAG: alpha-mannosidase [Clostridia bacterium]|nr:alpha-mannosidase [Clostridia bacterium]